MAVLRFISRRWHEFRLIARRAAWRMRHFRVRHVPLWLLVAVPAVTALSTLGHLSEVSWTPSTDRYFGAPRNCDEARARGLAPARRGEPGYAPWLDADNDGIACEPWPRERARQPVVQPQEWRRGSAGEWRQAPTGDKHEIRIR